MTMPKANEMSYAHDKPTCPKTRKTCHPTRSQAKKHSKYVKRRGKDKGVYQCDACSCWHLGDDIS